MSATKAYLAALEAGDERGLAKAEDRVRAEDGPAGLVTALAARLDREDTDEVRRALAEACVERAEEREGDDSREAALRAIALFEALGDEVETRRATALALVLAVADEETLRGTVSDAGGTETSLERLSKRLKDKEIKADAAETALFRRVASRVAELDGDMDRAFTEMLRAVRKAPAEPLYIDEAFRLALAHDKHEELALVFSDIASNSDLADRHRATIHNKVGHLKERGLGDPKGALLAYRKSVELNPKSKGAQRHVKRLEGVVKSEMDVPPTAVADPDEAETERETPTAKDTEKHPSRDEAPDTVKDSDDDAADADADADAVGGDAAESDAADSASDAVDEDAGDEEVEIGDEDVVEATAKRPRPSSSALSLPPPPPLSDEGDAEPVDDAEDAKPDEAADAAADSAEVEEDKSPSDADDADESRSDQAEAEKEPEHEDFSEADEVATAAGGGAPPTAVDTLGSQDFTAAEVTAPPETGGSSEDASDDDPHAPIDGNDGEDSTAKSGARPSAVATVLEVPAADTEVAPPPSAAVADSSSSSEEAEDQDVSQLDEPTIPPSEAPSPVSMEDADPQEPEVETEGEREADPKSSSTGIGPPPADEAARTVMEEGARDIFAEAGTLLGGDDVGACLDCAIDMQERPDKGSMPLRLAAHALALSAARGDALPELALDVYVEEAPGQGKLVVSTADELWSELPEERRADALPVWVAAARAAGDDVAEARRFLMPFAAADAPHGMAFRQLDQTLKDAGESRAREELWQKAFERNDAGERGRAILLGHVRMLTDAKRHRDTLPLYEKLVTEVAPGDEVLRDRALKAWERWGTAEERARFLGALASNIQGPQSIAVLKRLLQDRRRAEDDVGAEAAARALLERDAQNLEALEALCELLEPHAHRAEELLDLSRARLEMAKKRGRDDRVERFARELAARLKEHGRADEAADVLEDALERLPNSEHLFLEASAVLEEGGRAARQLALVESIADRTEDEDRKITMLLHGAEIAHKKLDRPGHAQELVARALEARPDDVGALLLRADLALELDDAQGALSSLERLAARLEDAADRARVHTRIGKLLEDHLLRPDDALKRYRAAVEANPKRKDAWLAMKNLFEQRSDRDGIVKALTGLARATEGKDAAAHFKEVARIERDERVDVERAEKALSLALERDPTDAEALDDLLHLVVARISGEHDLDTALMDPDEAVLDAVEEPISLVVDASLAAGVELSFPIRRLRALTAARTGERRAAREAFESLLGEQPTDLVSLRGYARFLKEEDDDDARARRLEILETGMLHHAPDLDPRSQVRLWGEVGAMRWDAGDKDSARKALKQALQLAEEHDLAAELSDHAASRAWRALESDRSGARAPAQIVVAGEVFGGRREGKEASDVLLEAARVAREEVKDNELARRVLKLAVEKDPESRAPRKSLLDLEVHDGNAEAAISEVRGLLRREKDKSRRADAQRQLAELLMSAGRGDEASDALRAALELDPSSRAALDAAEAFFADRKDARGLEALYSAQLKSIDKGDVAGRVALLERLAQVRRYDLRDLAGATEALEAISALDPEAVKPREDAARLYTELGQWREATHAWRTVLERDPLAREAWRGLFTLYARTGQGDEAFSVAAAMAAVDMGDEELTASVRQLRPPFPRWPRPPKESARFKRRLGHPLEATPLRLVLDRVGLRLHKALARSLGEFGLTSKDRIPERQVPPSVLLAVRTVKDLVGLGEMPRLYRAQATEGASPPPFALLPAPDPALVISEDALRGGMTPDRAFALGRAMAWLMPHAILAGTLSSAELKQVLESLVVRFIPGSEVEGNLTQLEHQGHQLENEIFRGLSGEQAELVRKNLLHALRDWDHARDQAHVADWMAGVGYTADRLGFLLTGDLVPAVRVIKSSGGPEQQVGARLAIKELVLFSVSQQYLTLRRELGLALPDSAARPIIELA